MPLFRMPFLLFLLALLTLAGAGLARAQPALAPRTVDSLSEAEWAALAELEEVYFSGIRQEAMTLVRVRFDLNTMLRTFPEQVRIIRQRKRQQLMKVTSYLYSLGLNPEFVEGHTERLRHDVLDYALDEMIKKSIGLGSPR